MPSLKNIIIRTKLLLRLSLSLQLLVASKLVLSFGIVDLLGHI